MTRKKKDTKQLCIYLSPEIRALVDGDNRSQAIAWRIEAYQIIYNEVSGHLHKRIAEPLWGILTQAVSKHVLARESGGSARHAQFEVSNLLAGMSPAQMGCTPPQRMDLIIILKSLSVVEQLILSDMLDKSKS